MSQLPAAPEPKTALGRLRLLAPSAAVYVSPLCLGGMTFGDSWKELLGECNKETTFQILDFFFESGGNFLDTANNYQNEESETWIGEWMEKRGNRDQMVVATKYSMDYQGYKGFDGRINANFAANGTKSLHMSVRDSLKKLQTDYIDLLYVHWYDHSTSVPELMLSLNALLNQGKVLYLGASDVPAYKVAACNQYAQDHGLRGFVVYQGHWSAMDRDFERDILPMARDFGMGICPFGALGQGNFKPKAQRDQMAASGEQGRNWAPRRPEAEAITDVLEAVARTKPPPADGRDWHPTSVALAYIQAKAPFVFPIVGGRKVDHLKGNVEALSLRLEPEEVEKIEAATPFDPGFPNKLIGQRPEDNSLLKAAGTFDFVQPPAPIRPARSEGAPK